MLRIFRKKDISKSNYQSGKMVTLTSPLGERMPAGQVRGRRLNRCLGAVFTMALLSMPLATMAQHKVLGAE